MFKLNNFIYRMKDNVMSHLQESQILLEDFKNENIINKSFSLKKLITRSIFYFSLSIIAAYISFYVYITVENINERVSSKNKDYYWPCISDFLNLIWELPLVIVILLFI